MKKHQIKIFLVTLLLSVSACNKNRETANAPGNINSPTTDTGTPGSLDTTTPPPTGGFGSAPAPRNPDPLSPALPQTSCTGGCPLGTACVQGACQTTGTNCSPMCGLNEACVSGTCQPKH